MIGHALIPARTIIAGLRRLQQGDLGWRLPGFRTVEFNLIARAVNDLAGELSRTNAARTALTSRLFQVQEEGRRALARDLHDEFGQCLTATAALAASIETAAAPKRTDLVDDARAIARIQKQMMENLRGALVRLRSQDIEEIGLEATLRQLILDHNMRAGSGAVFRLNVNGKLSALPKQVAIDIYRIAQECLTNAVRHGSPTEVKLSVERTTTGSETIAVTVEDDGGGDAGRLDRHQGHGVLGNPRTDRHARRQPVDHAGREGRVRVGDNAPDKSRRYACALRRARMSGVSILLVDDHPVVREGYRRLLERQAGFRVCAEAGDAKQAYHAYKDNRPDIVVMDLALPGSGGLEAIRHIRQWDKDAKILVFTMHLGVAFALKAFEAGTSGYVTKKPSPAN